jgi:hypothetical protein
MIALQEFEIEPEASLTAKLVDAWRACRRGGIEADQQDCNATTPGGDPDTLCLKPCTSCACRRCPGRCIWLASHDPESLHACCGHRLPANFNTLTFEERRNCPMAEDDEDADGGTAGGSSQMSGGDYHPPPRFFDSARRFGDCPESSEDDSQEPASTPADQPSHAPHKSSESPTTHKSSKDFTAHRGANNERSEGFTPRKSARSESKDTQQASTPSSGPPQ